MRLRALAGVVSCSFTAPWVFLWWLGMKLTIDYLNECVEYNKLNGTFKWKQRPSNHFKSDIAFKAFNTFRAGNIAGHYTQQGYIKLCVSFNGVPHGILAHVAAWGIVHGTFPVGIMDHIDLNRSNNRITNLREASPQESAQNRGKQCNNTSGFKGVYWHKHSKKYRACIGVGRKQIALGYFLNPSDAHAAYCEAADLIYGEFSNHGC